jgi:hypothetical protein
MKFAGQEIKVWAAEHRRPTEKKNMKNCKKESSLKQREELLKTLKARFEKNLNRHSPITVAEDFEVRLRFEDTRHELH